MERLQVYGFGPLLGDTPLIEPRPTGTDLDIDLLLQVELDRDDPRDDDLPRMEDTMSFVDQPGQKRWPCLRAFLSFPPSLEKSVLPVEAVLEE